MEVMAPSPPVDFNFDSNSTSPFLTPPSSPPSHFFPFFSAPTSPSSSFRRLDPFSASIPFSWEEKPGTPKAKHHTTDNSFDNSGIRPSLCAIPFTREEKPTILKSKQRTTDFSYNSDVQTNLHAIPFSWEEKPGTPKTKQPASNRFSDDLGVKASFHAVVENEDDFEFDFSGHIDRHSFCLSAADELFDGGVIKPLKPPPRLQFSENHNDSPRSPRSPNKTNFFREALSPRNHHKKIKDFDPFEAAMEQTRRESNERGRERTYDSSMKGSRRVKGTRSLSPFRVCDIFVETEESSVSSASTMTSKNSSSSSRWRGYYKKWRLKDLLLFRSASEGRATTGKDPLKKYSLLKQGGGGGATEDGKSSSFRSTEDGKNSIFRSMEDGKTSSFRCTESGGSASRRRAAAGGPVSAHELHYTTNRAVSEEMRRKTFLPYNHGLLGCLGFNPAVHDISRGIGSVTRGRS